MERWPFADQRILTIATVTIGPGLPPIPDSGARNRPIATSYERDTSNFLVCFLKG
jgi:hypothetical protein